MKVGYLDIILIVLFFQLLTLIPFLIFQKTERGLSNKILGLFLLAKAICITNFLSFRLYDYTFNFFPHAFYFGTSFTILWGPTLYLYIRSLTQKKIKLNYSDMIHVLPFLIHFFILTINFHVYNAEAKRAIMQKGGLFTMAFWNTFYDFLYIYTFLYTMAALFRIREYQKALKGSFSAIDSINLSWMNFVLYGFLLKWFCDICYHLAGNHEILGSAALFTSRLSLLFFINIMIYKALKQPFLFLGYRDYLKLKKQSLSDISKETYLQKLLYHMEKERPYLNPDLTLEELSKMVSIPPRSLTTVMNECLNQNFYDFINSYRVKESARMLLEKSPKFKTILEVLFEAGFKNKSSFNTAFKKHNGMTPTEYRKLQAPQLP